MSQNNAQQGDSNDNTSQTPSDSGRASPSTAEPAASDQADISQLVEELEAAKDQSLRARAELENYRKRQQRELEETRRYAAMPLLRSLLPVVDNLDRAVEAGEQSADAQSLLEGVQLVSRQLHEVLKQQGCTQIEALHAPFDPNEHEAMLQRPDPRQPPGTVVEVVQLGFRLHDRVVRPAQVIVSTGPAEEASNR